MENNFNDQAEPRLQDVNSEQLNNLQIENNPSKDFFNFLLDLLKTGVVVFIIAFVLRYFVIQPYIVDGESMMPNYVNNEYLLAEKISYMLSQPQRGDVIVFRYPRNPSVNYIKRIIGLPGETVTISTDKIKITNAQNPDGFVLNESYIPVGVRTEVENGSTMTKKLGENEYFVLGDNREHSSDSREWGSLPKANIAGRSWVSIAKLGSDNLKGFQFFFKAHQRVKYSEDFLKRAFLALNS